MKSQVCYIIPPPRVKRGQLVYDISLVIEGEMEFLWLFDKQSSLPLQVKWLVADLGGI